MHVAMFNSKMCTIMICLLSVSLLFVSYYLFNFYIKFNYVYFAAMNESGLFLLIFSISLLYFTFRNSNGINAN